MQITRILLDTVLLIALTSNLLAQGSIGLLNVASDTTVTQAKVDPTADLIKRLGDKPEDYGALVKDHNTGFDTHTDTAFFHNFKSFLGPDGDCMGISCVTRQVFLRVKWHADQAKEKGTKELVEALTSTLIRPIGGKWIDFGGYPNLREASKDDNVHEALRKVMTLGQLRNLNPQAFHWLLAVHSWGSQHQKLTHFIDQGKPVLIAQNKAPELNGHITLAYRVVEFEKKSLIMIYDCNYGDNDVQSRNNYIEGQDDATYKSVLVYDRASDRVSYHQRYKDSIAYDYDNIFVMQNADLELILERAKDFITETIPHVITETIPNAVGGLIKHLPFVG